MTEKKATAAATAFRDKPRSADSQPRQGGWNKFDREPRPEREKKRR
ncbi:MAG: hypothetical protein LRY51_12640 [Geovibrio sp.]|nr:hypothetical protein [Geovibrio sp.]